MSLGILTVDAEQKGFLLDGKPWFWFADTCWSAFTNITLDQWDYYLARRAEQGVNVLQLNTLPQWDRCRPDLGIYPYASNDGTLFDWTQPNYTYWERARKMAKMAQDHGIRLALVLVWSNFVPGTWASVLFQKLGSTLMPLEVARAHVRHVVDQLGEFDPVYIVSGDTDFKNSETVHYYEQLLTEICDMAPSSLRCMHINRGNRTIPEAYLNRLSFYMYQPGHNYEAQYEAWKLPEDFRALYPRKPLLNSEPCYEQIGASRHVYWRFSAKDCRASAWSGILAGALAGITYGAHGIWNWKTSQSDDNTLGEGFDAPFRWHECLQFPGIWDFGLIPELLNQIIPAGTIEPAQELLDDTRDQIRVARTRDRIIAYLPRTTTLRLRHIRNLFGESKHQWRAVAFDLEQKRIAHLHVISSEDGNLLKVLQHPFCDDALVVVERVQ